MNRRRVARGILGTVPWLLLGVCACSGSGASRPRVDVGASDGGADGAVSSEDASSADSGARGDGSRPLPDATVFPPLAGDAAAGTGGAMLLPQDAGPILDGACLAGGALRSLGDGLGLCEAPFEVDLTDLSVGKSASLEVEAMLGGTPPAPLGLCGQGVQYVVAFVIEAPANVELRVGVSAEAGTDFALLTQPATGSGCSGAETMSCVDSTGAGECETLRLDPNRHLSSGRVQLFVATFDPEGVSFLLHFHAPDPGADAGLI